MADLCPFDLYLICWVLNLLLAQHYRSGTRVSTFMTDLTSTDSSQSLNLKWLSYRLFEPYSLKVTVGVTVQW